MQIVALNLLESQFNKFTLIIYFSLSPSPLEIIFRQVAWRPAPINSPPAVEIGSELKQYRLASVSGRRH